MDREIEVRFTEIFKTNAWKGKSRSGPGSDEENTRAIKKFLPEFIKQYDIKWMVDIPCGDYNWMSQIELGCHYIGCDIVPEIIEGCRQNYPDVDFFVADISASIFHKVDLVLTRDCLVHFPTTLIKETLGNLSGSKYVMLTHFTGNRPYVDIPLGGWRPINFTLPPFNLSPPLVSYNEEYNDKAYSDKTISVWRGKDLV